MYCVKCGESLEEDAKFCSGCGAVVVSDRVIAKKNTKWTQMPKAFRVGIICIGMLVCVWGIANGMEKTASISEYEKPVQNLVKAVNNNDYEKFKEIIPEFIWKSEKTGRTEEEIQKIFYERYIKNAPLSFEILEIERLNKDEVVREQESLEWYTDEVFSVSAAYRLSTIVEIGGRTGEKTLTVLKIDGKWYLSPSSV